MPATTEQRRYGSSSGPVAVGLFPNRIKPTSLTSLSDIPEERKGMASPAEKPDGRDWKPASAPRESWKTWTYLEWNEELLKYCFCWRRRECRASNPPRGDP